MQVIAPKINQTFFDSITQGIPVLFGGDFNVARWDPEIVRSVPDGFMFFPQAAVVSSAKEYTTLVQYLGSNDQAKNPNVYGSSPYDKIIFNLANTYTTPLSRFAGRLDDYGVFDYIYVAGLNLAGGEAIRNELQQIVERQNLLSGGSFSMFPSLGSFRAGRKLSDHLPVYLDIKPGAVIPPVRGSSSPCAPYFLRGRRGLRQEVAQCGTALLRMPVAQT